MPPAARMTDPITIPWLEPSPPPPPTGALLPPAFPTVLIGDLPAARETDQGVNNGQPDIILSGSLTVLIGDLPAARERDFTAQGGLIRQGCPTVLIGEPIQGAALIAAALAGMAFCEECDGFVKVGAEDAEEDEEDDEP